jgi:hypothetical protein
MHDMGMVFLLCECFQMINFILFEMGTQETQPFHANLTAAESSPTPFFKCRTKGHTFEPLQFYQTLQLVWE